MVKRPYGKDMEKWTKMNQFIHNVTFLLSIGLLIFSGVKKFNIGKKWSTFLLITAGINRNFSSKFIFNLN